MQREHKYGDSESLQDTALTLDDFSYYYRSLNLKQSYSRSLNLKQSYYTLNVLTKVHFIQTFTQIWSEGSTWITILSLRHCCGTELSAHFFSFHLIYWTTTRFVISGSFVLVLMLKIFQCFTTYYNLEQTGETACTSTSLTLWANIYKDIHVYFQAPPFNSSPKKWVVFE